jgi:hypothetical protein
LGWAVKDSISNSVGVRVKIVSATDKALLRAARVREVCGNANHHIERNDNLAPNSRPGRDGVAERILATYRKSVSVASVTSVRCSPWGANSRPGRDGVAERIWPPTAIPLRELRAMLSLGS